MKQKVVAIFDFDGTLADTAPIMRTIYSEIAKKNRLKVMTDEDYAMLRRGTLREAKKWSGVHFWQFPLLVWNVKRLMKLEAEKVRLFPEIVELLKELQKRDIDLYILSRNNPGTILRVLERYKLNNDIVILARRKRSFGSKAAVITNLVQRQNYNPEKVWMIGDEVRDIAAAHRAGVKSIAVSWGLQDESILKRYNPTQLVTAVGQISKIVR